MEKEKIVEAENRMKTLLTLKKNVEKSRVTYSHLMIP